MKTLLYTSVTLLTLLCFDSGLAAQSISGEWHGLGDLGTQKLRVTFDFQEDGDEWTATMSSPDQGMFGTPVDRVSLEDSQVDLFMEGLGLEFSGKYSSESETISGRIKQGSLDIPLELQREPIESPYHRPQHPKEPYPYFSTDVQFKNPDADIMLRGTIAQPNEEFREIAAIMITGSGPQNRDEELAFHKPFLVIADHLARNGIATLRYDDRGVGESEGSFSGSTSYDFTEDAIAAIQYLRLQGYEHVGIIGHSEGGMIAALVAAQTEVDFVISLAGTAVDGFAVLEQQNLDIAISEGLPKKDALENRRKLMEMCAIVRDSDDIEQNEKDLHAYMDSTYAAEKNLIPDFEAWKNDQVLALNNIWMHYFMNINPCESWKKVDCPVLALNGTKDLQVDHSTNLKALENCLIEAGNMDFTLSPLKNHNHLFQYSETGRVSEYGDLEETFSPRALNIMTDWISERFVRK